MTGRIINLGSLCIDRVFNVEHIVRGGETISAGGVQLFAGGKGLNQSLAARRAGADVIHVGVIGSDGEFLRALLRDEGVDVAHVRTDAHTFTGNAVIQVTTRGDNAIVIVGGANRALTEADVQIALVQVRPGDWFLLQNEINDLDGVLRRAAVQGARVCLNLAPFDARAFDMPFGSVAMLIVNELEAEGLTGESAPAAAMRLLRTRCPSAVIVLTLGEQGLVYSAKGGNVVQLPAFVVDTVDGTGAGDGFIGYLLAGLLTGLELEPALLRASAAGAITASRAGAAPAIPFDAEVTTFLRSRELNR